MGEIANQLVGRNDQPLGAYEWSDHSNALVLTANTADSITVPTGYHYAAFDSDGFIWVALNETAVVPSANITDGSAPHPNPGFRRVTPGDTISVICEEDTKVGVYFYTE